MAADAWLPIGFCLPDGAITRMALAQAPDWQIIETKGDGRALIADDLLAQRWINSGLLDAWLLSPFQFGDRRLWAFSSGPSQLLCPVSDGRSPNSAAEALSFAIALRATRQVDEASPLQDALYVERLSRLLPTYSISSRVPDDVVLGYWLTGGASISATFFRRLHQTLTWLSTSSLRDIVEAAGFRVDEPPFFETSGASLASGCPTSGAGPLASASLPSPSARPGSFSLPGRPELTLFFNEHVIDILVNRERYSRLGITFPSAVVLHGPPGCGKTFAVQRLVEFLGWPSFEIDAASVASPYIHETSRKIAAVFDKAIASAPSVLLIDEMEAFVADRDVGSGQHHVEEVAEFLRRIPDAPAHDVLVMAMTNRLELIDPAILRRGRFDHLVKVDFPSEPEVAALLEHLLSTIPKAGDIEVAPVARALAGRPLSDVNHVVREGARIAARSGKRELDQSSLLAALESTPAREREGAERRRIGFI